MTQKKSTRKRSARRSKNDVFSPEMEKLILEPIAKAMAGKPLEEGLKEGAPLKNLIGKVVEMALQEEMQEHLGYSPNERIGDADGDSRKRSNVRNGYSSKTLKTSQGAVEVDIPRDRHGEFEPQIVPKHQTISEEMERRVIAMYTKGMTTRDIESYVTDIYGIESSPMFVSRLSKRLDEELTLWRNRPLEAMYPVVFVDAMYLPVRHARSVSSTAVYQACAYNESGKLEVLGIYMSETENGRKEASSYWHQIFIELEKRGLKDILILCADGLSGLEEAASAVYPDVRFQPCVVHLVRSSGRLLSHKHRSGVMALIKAIYAAPSYEAAELALKNLRETWGDRYPGVVDQWEKNLPRLADLWSYSEPLRKMVYTTNAIENVHRQVRKVTKNRSSMPNISSTLRLISLVMRDLNDKSAAKKQPRNDWRRIVSELPIHFGERIPKDWGHRLQTWSL